MAVLDDLKVLLDIPVDETELDGKLNLIIRNAERGYREIDSSK